MTETDFSSTTDLIPTAPAPSRSGLSFVFSSPWRLALIYLIILTVAELMTAIIEPRIGMILHGLLLIAILIQSALGGQPQLRRFLITFAMAPLIRVVSVAMPLPDYPLMYWYLIVGAPLFLATVFVAKAGRINRKMLGLKIGNLPVQLGFSLVGIGLGYLEFKILAYPPLVPEFNPVDFLLSALILMIFTGFLEELIFRGLMQYTALRSFGWLGLVYVSVVFAVLHIGHKSFIDIIFVLVVALLFSWFANRTGSLLGVTLAHGLTNIGLFLVFPFLAPMFPAATAALPPQGIPVTGSAPSLTPVFGTATDAPIIVTPTRTASAAPGISAPPVWPTETPSPTITRSPLPSVGVSLVTASPTTTHTPTGCQPPPGWVVYTVQSGDTLTSLSMRTGTTVQALRQANCLTSTLIITGQKLFVPILPAALTRPTATQVWVPTSPPSQAVTRTNTPAPTQTQLTSTPPAASPTAPPPTSTPITPTAAPTVAQ